MMKNEKRKPIPCSICGKLSNNDWMYLAKLTEDVWCGDCKKKISAAVFKKAGE